MAIKNFFKEETKTPEWINEANAWAAFYMTFNDDNEHHMKQAFASNGGYNMSAEELHQKNIGWIKKIGLDLFWKYNSEPELVYYAMEVTMELVVNEEHFFETLNEREKNRLADVIMNHLTPDEIVAKINPSDKDALYRLLWYDHVYQDILHHAQALDKSLNDNGVQSVARRYVYDGDYDTELPYWDNIESLINEAYENEDYRWVEEDMEME